MQKRSIEWAIHNKKNNKNPRKKMNGTNSIGTLRWSLFVLSLIKLFFVHVNVVHIFTRKLCVEYQSAMLPIHFVYLCVWALSSEYWRRKKHSGCGIRRETISIHLQLSVYVAFSLVLHGRWLVGSFVCSFGGWLYCGWIEKISHTVHAFNASSIRKYNINSKQ